MQLWIVRDLTHPKHRKWSKMIVGRYGIKIDKRTWMLHGTAAKEAVEKEMDNYIKKDVPIILIFEGKDRDWDRVFGL
jgi:hypothetical protein